FSFAHVRIPGVLQRIALVYVAAAVITLHASPRVRAAIAVALTLVHWWVLSLAPLTPRATIAAHIDHAVFGSHLLLPTYDPEGLLGTLSAIASALVGTLAGDWLRTGDSDARHVRGLLVGGAALTAAGLLWSLALPINKPLWTGSYTAFTGGLALLALAACYQTIEIAGARTWARPFVWLGVNPLAIYFLAELIAHIFELTTVKTTLYWGLLRPATTHRLSDASASLLFAVVTTAVWTLVAGVMYRRGVRVQV